MGGRAGGSGTGFGSRIVSLGATERGYSREFAKAVFAQEAAIKDYGVEHGIVFDEKGNVIAHEIGNQYQVGFNPRDIKGRVVTHNHPDGYDAHGLSGADLRAVVQGDMKELRAVTGSHVFSVKRPSGGWGKTAGAVTRKYNDVVKKQALADRKFIDSYKGDKKALGKKLDATFYHRVTKTVTKSFGWDYTYKKT